MTPKRKAARTPTPAPVVVDREQRPPVEAIRAAAFTQFAERGYPVVTVRDIMKACGLTQGALYNHFKSKDELLHDIIASTQGELERICQQAVTGALALTQEAVAIHRTLAKGRPDAFLPDLAISLYNLG